MPRNALTLIFLFAPWCARAGVIEITGPEWVVPSDRLPAEVSCQAANNNLALAHHEGRLFLSWRTAPLHFASPLARLYVVSTADGGASWDFELDVALGADVREPYLLSFGGALVLSFFEAGEDPFAFEPQRMWRARRQGPAQWTELEVWGEPGEVPWDFWVEDGRVYRTSYLGDHYGLLGARVDLRFHVSDDGLVWEPVGEGVVYTGGVSECAIAFDAGGTLWAVTRNEDGDRTGFGSHVATADASDLGDWDFPERADPERYDSPRMFRQDGEIYLVARRDVGGPYDQGMDWLPLPMRRAIYLPAYSSRPKRTALYRLDTQARTIEHVVDLAGAADTAFPSVVRLGPDEWLVGNYTSPLWFRPRSWLSGQISPRGTRIYFSRIRFHGDAPFDSVRVEGEEEP